MSLEQESVRLGRIGTIRLTNTGVTTRRNWYDLNNTPVRVSRALRESRREGGAVTLKPQNPKRHKALSPKHSVYMCIYIYIYIYIYTYVYIYICM